MNIVHIPDITGDGSVKSLAQIFAAAGVSLPQGNKVKWIYVTDIVKGSTTSRIGNASVSATQGMLCSEPVDLRPIPGYDNDSLYDLNQIYLFAATGDTISIAVGIWNF